MTTEYIPKVINTHWFMGPDKLPPNTMYIGRPSKHGNPYSSKTGKYSREECIALHRIGLYRAFTSDPSHFKKLQVELMGRDLACWCKQAKKLVGCHGDNFLHVFSGDNLTRDYSRTVVNYLMDDLRKALDSLQQWILHDAPSDQFMWLDIHTAEVRMEISRVLVFCKEHNPALRALEFLLGQLVIDIELARLETSQALIEFRLDHAVWVIARFFSGNEDRSQEPTPPDSLVKKKFKSVKMNSSDDDCS